MYHHEKVNRIIGWSIGGLAFLMYAKTTAPVVAFWDNGEFIAVGHILGVGHPPGSPLYTLACRLFSILPFSNVARAVNFESVVTASLAVALLYFCVTKIVGRWEKNVESLTDGLPTYISGISACLFAAFSFSYWENALEAEVYATNIFTMLLTLWLVLRWSELKEIPRNRAYLYLIIYLMALGVGVHLGCVLWAPAFILFAVLFEHSILGIVFLGIPLAMGFALVSKGIVRGAIGIWLLWLAVTVFYAIPALWPKAAEPRRRKDRKQSGKKPAAARFPMWLVAGLAVVELVILLATSPAYGGKAAGFFFGSLVASAAAVAIFARLVKIGFFERPEIPARMLLSVVALSAVALSSHAYLLIRARLKPAINESNPNTWALVLDVVRRKQYEPMKFFPRRAAFGTQFSILWSYYRPQFTIWPLILAVWGAVVHARKEKRTFALLAVAFVMASIGLLFYLNISDHEVRSREYFWVPSYVGLALWMGIGSGAILAWAKNLGKAYRNVMVAALIVFSLLPLVKHYHTRNRSENYVAHYYGWNMLNFLEGDAILFTNGDNDTFPLWYLQEVDGIRPDVDVVNLALLQINWYIEQLKDRDLPMSLTYGQIEQLRPFWGKDRETGELRAIGLKDIAVPDIIAANDWKRPVYFAVTVEDFMGYYDNLSLEGMVFRLVPERMRHQINVEKTYENVFENYRYDSIVDKDDDWRVVTEVYKPPDTRRLITNYSAGFSRLAFHAMQGHPQDVDEAIRLYALALKFGTNYTPALNGLIAIYAARLRQPEKALPYAELLLKAHPEQPESWLRYGGVHMMVGEDTERYQPDNVEQATAHFDEARKAYERVLEIEPDRTEIYAPLLSIYSRLGLEVEAQDLLGLWERYAPEELERRTGDREN